VQRLGWDARAQVLASELLPQALRERYSSVSGALLERVSEAFAAAAGTARSASTATATWEIFCGTSTARCSWTWMIAPRGTRAGPVDDACRVPAEQQREWGELLAGYGQFADFDFSELLLIEPLRSLRMLHHAAWVAHRWSDPASRAPFPGSPSRATGGYLNDLLEQIPPSMSHRSCSCESRCRSARVQGTQTRYCRHPVGQRTRTYADVLEKGVFNNLGPALAATVMLFGCSSPETPGVAAEPRSRDCAPQAAAGRCRFAQHGERREQRPRRAASVQVKFELRERPMWPSRSTSTS